MKQEGVYSFLGFFDAFSILIWLIVLVAIVNQKYKQNSNKSHYRYYKRGFYAKLFAAIIFSFVYIVLYGGGDSTAYWDAAQKLNNLFWENPLHYFTEMFTNNPLRDRFVNFNPTTTGMPPRWIYREDEAWFASKIYSILSFVTFRSYFAMTMITAYISFVVSWKLYELILVYKIIDEKNGAIGALFLPSTCFWCTGITKDMLVYSSVIYLLIQLFTFLNPIELKKYRNSVWIILCGFLILNIRDFMLITVLGPFFIAIGARWSRVQKSGFSKWFIQISFILVILFAMTSFLGSDKGQEFATEAELIQDDLKNNQTYGDNKYDLGITDFTSTGMLKAMPISIYTAFYRPYIWEGNSVFIMISAFESFFFLLITLRLIFSKNFISKINEIKTNEILITALTFAIIVGFFAGYTSGLFGVLVRFKAPLLPFLYLVLMYEKQDKFPYLESKA